MHPDQRRITPARHNLPRLRTSFIGREHATAEIGRLLRGARLLTLVGAGGSGKTRLALRVAEQSLAEYPHGVWWVDLAALTDPNLLPQTIAGVLSLAEQPDRSFTEILGDHLREHAVLLILDNCEHLRAACSELLGALFAAGCADDPQRAVGLLATSREPLAVEGEQVWTVPLLALPDPRASQWMAELQGIEAVRLFVERAQVVAPGFQVSERNAEAVAEICRRIEGLPLAIELAAARVNVLAPRQIAERLDDSVRLLTRGALGSDARQQTLRAALDWSFDLLSRPEQTLFTRLAVFAGSFALEAVEGVCAGPGADDPNPAAEPRHLEPDALWFDVDAFEAGLREAQALLRTGAQDERATRLLEEAVNLYQNDFAEDLLDGERPAARREALRHAYLEALLALGRLHTEAGRDEQAIAVYQRALAKDAYLEDAHLEVIRAYVRLNRRRQAFGQYATLKAALAELNVTPSAETTTLIECLRCGDLL